MRLIHKEYDLILRVSHRMCANHIHRIPHVGVEEILRPHAWRPPQLRCVIQQFNRWFLIREGHDVLSDYDCELN